ncbi:MAG TPA: hypothetical protein VGJ25_09075 [Gaiellaceae bacterium]|jgi:hypothetical protein
MSELTQDLHVVAQLARIESTLEAIRDELEQLAGPPGRRLPYRNPELLNAPDIVSGGPAALFWWYVYNPGVAAVFVHLYDESDSNVSIGSEAMPPRMTLWVPAGSLEEETVQPGLDFHYGIVAAATTTLTGSGQPATGPLVQFGCK